MVMAPWWAGSRRIISSRFRGGTERVAPKDSGKNDAARKDGIENGRKVIELAMKTKGFSPFIAGELSLADLYLAPIAFYVSLTPDKDAVFDLPGFADWWSKIQALPSFKETQPKLS